MVTKFEPTARKIDEEVSQLIAKHVEAHHRRAERLHFAETGSVGPVDEERETFDEMAKLLKMAGPEIDGDEQAAIDRLRSALIEAEHRTES